VGSAWKSQPETQLPKNSVRFEKRHSRSRPTRSALPGKDIPEPLPAGRFRDNSPLLTGGRRPEGDSDLHLPERLLLGLAEGRPGSSGTTAMNPSSSSLEMISIA